MKSGEAVGMVKVGRIIYNGNFEAIEDINGGWVGRGELAIETEEKNYYLDTHAVEDTFRRMPVSVTPRLKKHCGFTITPLNVGHTLASVYIILD